MKRFILLLLLSITALYATPQSISVKAFRQLENDLDARVNYPKKDQNVEVCAIIKVVTTQTGFTFDVGSLGVFATEQKAGEIWVYVPRGVQRITIGHSQLGILRNYAFTIPIQSAMVYELELVTARVTTIVEEVVIPTQWLVITSEPDGADVYINDQLRGQTPFQMEFEVGDHSYRLDKILYHPEAGKLTLTADKRETLNLKLRPNFGYIKVSTTPESGASVTVNGSPLPSSTPVTTSMLKSGVYTVAVNKSLFHDASQQVTVTDGQTASVTLAMRPAFGGVSVITTPETGAEVLLNGNPTGKTTPTTLERLPQGEHTITVRKEWYQPQTQRVTLADGDSRQLSIALQPTFGNVKITAEADATIYVANERKANGSWEGRLVAGSYTVEGRKDKHTTDTQRLQVELGQTHNLSLHPKPMQGELKIVTTPFDAKITLNGKDYGTTPNTVRDLLIGSYTLTLTKPSFGTVTKTITIAEGQTVEVTETLPSGMEVTIASNPSGAQLSIDGSATPEPVEGKGSTTPWTGTLAFGRHALKLANGKKVVEETITVTQGGKTRWEFDVQIGKEITLSSTPSGAQLTVDGKFIGSTPVTTTLAFGSHTLKLVNGKKEVTETITLTQGGKVNWEFDVADFPPAGTFTDSRDQKTYKYVTIGKQVWMAENLAYKPSNDNYWEYDYKISNAAKYGYLYDWQIACKVCPTGWHLPSDAEWTELTNFGGSNPGTKLKTKIVWSKNSNGTDDFGFSFLPGGFRGYDGRFGGIGNFGYWWSSTERKARSAWCRDLDNDSRNVNRNYYGKEVGFSVRCLRDI